MSACLIEDILVICCSRSVLEVSSLSDRALLRRGGGSRDEQAPPDGLF